MKGGGGSQDEDWELGGGDVALSERGLEKQSARRASTDGEGSALSTRAMTSPEPSAAAPETAQQRVSPSSWAASEASGGAATEPQPPCSRMSMGSTCDAATEMRMWLARILFLSST